MDAGFSTVGLEKIGEAALHALRKAIENRPALGVRRRLEQLIEKQAREEWKPSAEGRRLRRALEVLERAGTAEARRTLETLAGGAPGAWLTVEGGAGATEATRSPITSGKKCAHRPCWWQYVTEKVLAGSSSNKSAMKPHSIVVRVMFERRRGRRRIGG
jgi:hypothetical protein